MKKYPRGVPPQHRLFVTTAEFADHVGQSQSTIRSWCHDGIIPFVRLANQAIRIPLRAGMQAWAYAKLVDPEVAVLYYPWLKKEEAGEGEKKKDGDT